ncbi:alanine racemase [Streptomyces sp. NPDC003952]
MIQQHRQPLLPVDLAAVAANTRRLRARTTATCMAVVKADGFGHGAVEIARNALAPGAEELGAATLTEALALRGAGLTAPVLSRLNSPYEDFAPTDHGCAAHRR